MTKILVDKAVIEQALDALFMYKPMVTGVTFQHRLDAAKALRAVLEQPQGEQELDAFYEWWHMRPSLTRLQAWLLWKDEQKQLERAHGIGGEA